MKTGGLTGVRARNTLPAVKTWPLLLVAGLLSGCGARTGLDAPPIAFVEPGPLPSYCNGAEDTAVYVVTDQNELLRFEPTPGTFTPIGPVECPVTQSGASPFSMAVDHLGTAYVVFDDGELFEVSTASAACTATSTPVDTTGFTSTYGMGFSSDSGGLAETLFLASVDSPDQLGTLDTGSFVVQEIGTFSTDIGESELTGTGDGRLFAFGVVQSAAGATLAELDKLDASVISTITVPTPEGISDWAFAFWGGDFYFFTSVDGTTSSVGRFHPADGSFDASYATLATGAITGAGVSTCAPR